MNDPIKSFPTLRLYVFEIWWQLRRWAPEIRWFIYTQAMFWLGYYFGGR